MREKERKGRPSPLRDPREEKERKRKTHCVSPAIVSSRRKAGRLVVVVVVVMETRREGPAVE